jgi:hypothetical protein
LERFHGGYGNRWIEGAPFSITLPPISPAPPSGTSIREIDAREASPPTASMVRSCVMPGKFSTSETAGTSSASFEDDALRAALSDE